MVLNNVTLVQDGRPVNIAINGETISAVTSDQTSSTDHFQLGFSNAIAFPGLINSHDHLDFNCFPALGDRTYHNYTEWGKHIHSNYKEDIREVLQVPAELRTQWGIYKNLLAGITTVVNHGRFLKITNPLIAVMQRQQSLHSVQFQRGWKWKLNNPFLKTRDCVIHTGEGADERSSAEIDELLQWNLFNRKLIGIHAVAMQPWQAKKFKGLVWCPESNRFLLNKDADIRQLKDHTQVVFGTDSTLTGNWNVWHHLRLARKTGQVSDAELFEMITERAGKLWELDKGTMEVRKDADIVVAKKKTGNAVEDFFSTDPEDILLVVAKGRIRLFDTSLFSQLAILNFDTSGFHAISVNGIAKFVEGNLPQLIDRIKLHYPGAVFPCRPYEFFKTTTDA